MNVRVLPSADVLRQSLVVSGRSYTAAPGAYLDVPVSDAAVLGANGWLVIGAVGTTGERPTRRPDGGIIMAGERFLDTTIGALLVYDGQVWRNQITGAIV